MPSDEEQIRALLKGEAHTLVHTTLGKDQLEHGDYARVITVSFGSAVEYLIAHHSIGDIANTKESQRDGYYALPDGEHWVAYCQEKGADAGRDILRSELEVFSHFVRVYLGLKPEAD